jgi:regulator of protease activity HflC (stomatin/prohibitin superfamily)
VSDDPSRSDVLSDLGASAANVAAAAPYVQLIEVEAGPLEAGEAIERADELGRIPVVVRVRRQAPVNPVIILVAIGIMASGLFVPLATALRAMIVIAGAILIVVGLLSRLMIRVPPGTVGLVVKGGRHQKVLEAGVRWVSPVVALSHVVTTREIAFDVPVTEVRSADGIGITIDSLLTIRISDPIKFVYAITARDADQYIQAACQDAVRMLVRSIDALSTLDLGAVQAARLQDVVAPKLDPYGVGISGVAITRVSLPAAITESLEARRLASLQIAEAAEAYQLDKRRLADQAALIAQEAESRRHAVELEAENEAIRLSKLEERLAANPVAARYDLDAGRLRALQELAGNAHAVVSFGGSDLIGSVVAAQAAQGMQAVPSGAPVPVASAEPASPDQTASPEAPAKDA